MLPAIALTAATPSPAPDRLPEAVSRGFAPAGPGSWSGGGGGGGFDRGGDRSWSDDNHTGASLSDVRSMIQGSSGTAAGLTGHGIGIALIDTGVAPVPQLSASQVVNGPDLSFESQAPNLRYLDTFGHGTHMAGIMVSNGALGGPTGLARRAKLTSIKAGVADGSVDVSQIIAAIDWVVKNKNHDPAFPIRVINLSYGAGGNPSSTTDPLQFAVEQAWKAGIVVVAAAGNEAKGQLSNPATDPFVLAVGAADTKGTRTNTDDTVSTFTNGKKAGRSFDLVAPGEGILSLRNPGSNIDVSYPTARVGDATFRGSGTSQATAVASAAVALLLEARPTLTPDQVKQLLIGSGTPLSGTDAGKKMVNLNRALATAASTGGQRATWSTGTGLLEPARGTSHVAHNGKSLTGENSVWGPFSTATWAKQSAARTAWSGGVWSGHRVAGDGWTGSSWTAKTWAPATWPGLSFGGSAWYDPSWSGRFWSGRFWSGGAWVGRFWSSSDWFSVS